MRRFAITALAVALALTLGAVAGCTKSEDTGPKQEAKVKPPAIAEAGVLRAGVDLDYPPFAGEDKGKQAGIDIDVARALAAKLGLKLELVSVVASEAATALDSKDADVVFSVPFTEQSLARTSIAGSYIADGPVFFTTTDETVTVDSVGARAIAAQDGSEAFWALENALGPEVVQGFPTLREALQSLNDGKVAIVGGDAVVGAYIARDFPSVQFAGQIEAAHLLGVAVAKDNTALGDAVRASLDELAADGALATVRRTWIGDLPELELPKQ